MHTHSQGHICGLNIWFALCWYALCSILLILLTQIILWTPVFVMKSLQYIIIIEKEWKDDPGFSSIKNNWHHYSFCIFLKVLVASDIFIQSIKSFVCFCQSVIYLFVQFGICLVKTLLIGSPVSGWLNWGPLKR